MVDGEGGYITQHTKNIIAVAISIVKETLHYAWIRPALWMN